MVLTKEQLLMVCSYSRTYKIDKKKSYSPDICPELYETDILVYDV